MTVPKSSSKTGLVLGLALGLAATASADAQTQQIESLWSRVLKESARLTPCPATQEEVAAESLLRLLDKDPHYVDRCLRRTVRNKMVDRLRRHSREVRVGDLDGDPELLVTTGTPEDDTLGALAVEEFRAALDADETRVLELLEDGCSERDIARQLECPRYQVRTLRERLARKARRLL